jgi:hypothetical protein
LTTLGRIATTVRASPAPVAFLDSCTLLDVVRAPLRNKATEVRVARSFLAAARKAPKTIHLLIGSPTPKEWNDHVAKTEEECEDAIECCNAVAAACGHMGMAALAPLPTGTGTLPALLRQLSADLLAACVTMGHQAAAMSRAVDRIIAPRLPARKKGTGAKDSVIVEHAIELTTRLRAAGFTQPCVFVSSNTSDFAAPSSTAVHPDLATAFSAAQLDYAISLEHAETILLAAGWVP